MSVRRAVAVSMLLGLLATSLANGQQVSNVITWPRLAGCACSPVWPPIGFYIDSITEDGRYITLEDGTIWEVQIADRAQVGGWQRDEFVNIRPIWAPIGDYEWLFTNVNGLERRAAVRPAGRVDRPSHPDQPDDCQPQSSQPDHN